MTIVISGPEYDAMMRTIMRASVALERVSENWERKGTPYAKHLMELARDLEKLEHDIMDSDVHFTDDEDFPEVIE